MPSSLYRFAIGKRNSILGRGTSTNTPGNPLHFHLQLFMESSREDLSVPGVPCPLSFKLESERVSVILARITSIFHAHVTRTNGGGTVIANFESEGKQNNVRKNRGKYNTDG